MTRRPGKLFVAELTESLTEFRCADGSVRVSRQYLGCRYFVETLEISAWPSAQAYWASHGITSDADAEQCATASDGIHYSFYGISNTVAHSVILCEVSETLERRAHRGKLVSFALTLEDLREAREQLSAGAELPMDEGSAAEAALRAIRESAARETAAAAKAAARTNRSERRANDKCEREQQQQQQQQQGGGAPGKRRMGSS